MNFFHFVTSLGGATEPPCTDTISFIELQLFPGALTIPLDSMAHPSIKDQFASEHTLQGLYKKLARRE